MSMQMQPQDRQALQHYLAINHHEGDRWSLDVYEAKELEICWIWLALKRKRILVKHSNQTRSEDLEKILTGIVNTMNPFVEDLKDENLNCLTSGKKLPEDIKYNSNRKEVV